MSEPPAGAASAGRRTEVGVAARRLAIEAAERIDTGGAYANLLLPKLLADSGLEGRDRGFVTELVYGSTRMRRALDFAIARFLDRDDVEPRVRAALRIGAYQLIFLATPAHAAVDATVAATPKRARGFVNAILRKVAKAGSDVEWPNDAIRLSYPDWMLSQLSADLGDRALPVLAAMNTAATVHPRPDGYRQDPASQAVAALVDVAPGALVIDLCAAPGGKATYVAGDSSSTRGDGPAVIAVDIHPHRARLVRSAALDTSTDVHPVVADGTKPPFRSGCADAVLIDAPCSGLGSLRRRADARWRIKATDIDVLEQLQFDLVSAATGLLKPGGQLVYSVCTLTSAETIGVDDRIAGELPHLQPRPLPEPWEPLGRGGRLLPDAFEGDGMAVFVYDVVARPG